jgi:hypothetical protein
LLLSTGGAPHHRARKHEHRTALPTRCACLPFRPALAPACARLCRTLQCAGVASSLPDPVAALCVFAARSEGSATRVDELFTMIKQQRANATALAAVASRSEAEVLCLQRRCLRCRGPTDSSHPPVGPMSMFFPHAVETWQGEDVLSPSASNERDRAFCPSPRDHAPSLTPHRPCALPACILQMPSLPTSPAIRTCSSRSVRL